MSAMGQDGTVLVTGAAGFIGYHVTERLLADGLRVIGVDNINDYYDPQLKKDRLQLLRRRDAFEFHAVDLAEPEPLQRLFEQEGGSIRYVVHLAAQAGVRYSLRNPHQYARSNVVAFLNILEMCRHYEAKHLVYASSSSVYGANTSMPFRVSDPVDHPVSLYAATKKSNELMAHSYSHLFGLPTTGLRFFTVYGPWGRPDMAYFSFTRDILEGRTIKLFNYGEVKRDFTYIDDIVEGVVKVLAKPPRPDPLWDRNHPDPSTSFAPYKIYNIGNHESVQVKELVAALEELLGKRANVELAPMQPGDVEETYADISALQRDVGFRPGTPLKEGLKRFVSWYRTYYKY